MSKDKKVRLCIIVTSEASLRFLYRNQLEFLDQNGFEISAIFGPIGRWGGDWTKGIPAKFVPIKIKREPHPFLDVYSLFRIWWYLIWHRFDIVHVSTPKAGLLGAIAARLSFHANVFYTIRGRVYENSHGIKRKLFAFLDCFACKLSRHVYVISKELRNRVVDERISADAKTSVIANGSSSGVDLSKFCRSPGVVKNGLLFRERLGIPTECLVIISIGRIRREKGINELVKAFKNVLEVHPNTHLIVAGARENCDPLDVSVDKEIRQNRRIHEVAWQVNPEFAYAAADIVAFPTYREGFGNVTLEAGAMGLPVVAADVIGPREVIQDGINGFLVPPRDFSALSQALATLIDDANLRRSMGVNALRFIKDNFDQNYVFSKIVEAYSQSLR